VRLGGGGIKCTFQNLGGQFCSFFSLFKYEKGLFFNERPKKDIVQNLGWKGNSMRWGPNNLKDKTDFSS